MVSAMLCTEVCYAFYVGVPRGHVYWKASCSKGVSLINTKRALTLALRLSAHWRAWCLGT